MEETQAQNIDGKISPKGPWRCKNTVLLEIRIWPKKKKKTGKSNNFFLPWQPPRQLKHVKKRGKDKVEA